MPFPQLRETPSLLSVLSNGSGFWLRAEGRVHARIDRKRISGSVCAQGQEIAKEGHARIMEQTHKISHVKG